MNMTPLERRAAILMIQAIADCLRDLGEVPSGVFYARLMAMPGMSNISVTQYQGLIGSLEEAKVIEVKNHVIRWIGPKEAKS
jgi:hypothetical protein